MREPRWVDLQVVLAVHDEQLAEHGGESGVRDPGLLESALARPRQRHAYSEASLAQLAASYAYGIARDDQGCVMAFLQLADGSLGEEQLAAWLSINGVAGGS